LLDYGPLRTRAENQNDDGDDEDEMDEAAGDVKREETQEPENQKNQRKSSDHIPPFPGSVPAAAGS
jgi:hypothetical protein